jgi:5-methylcytosine-specific restriction endonuclease McrA
MTIIEAIQEIGEIPFTNSQHTHVYSLLKKGKVEEGLFYYRKSNENGTWLMSDEESSAQKTKRVNKREKGKGRTSKVKKYKVPLHKKQNYRCAMCREKKPLASLELDHIIPLSKGGINDIENLQLLCRGCHHQKDRALTNQPPVDNSKEAHSK